MFLYIVRDDIVGADNAALMKKAYGHCLSHAVSHPAMRGLLSEVSLQHWYRAGEGKSVCASSALSN